MKPSMPEAGTRTRHAVEQLLDKRLDMIPRIRFKLVFDEEVVERYPEKLENETDVMLIAEPVEQVNAFAKGI